MNETPRAYRNLGQKMAAEVDLLYLDIGRLVRREPSLTPARIAKLANLSSEWVVRDIRKPDWFVKNVSHLFKIEAALSDHPNWHPKTVLGESYTVSSPISVFRRWVDPFEAPEFQEIALRWTTRTSDADFIDQAMADPWVSTIDVSSGDPLEYRVLKYTPEMISRHGFDKSGERLSQHVSAAYAKMTTGDFHRTVTGKTPRSRDVVYSGKPVNDRVIYRGVLHHGYETSGCSAFHAARSCDVI
jgi:hypothetical protein